MTFQGCSVFSLTTTKRMALPPHYNTDTYNYIVDTNKKISFSHLWRGCKKFSLKRISTPYTLIFYSPNVFSAVLIHVFMPKIIQHWAFMLIIEKLYLVWKCPFLRFVKIFLLFKRIAMPIFNIFKFLYQCIVKFLFVQLNICSQRSYA